MGILLVTVLRYLFCNTDSGVTSNILYSYIFCNICSAPIYYSVFFERCQHPQFLHHVAPHWLQLTVRVSRNFPYLFTNNNTFLRLRKLMHNPNDYLSGVCIKDQHTICPYPQHFDLFWIYRLIKTSDGAGADKTRRLDAISKVVYEVFPEPNRQLLQRYLPRLLFG